MTRTGITVTVYVPQGPHQGVEIMFGYTYVTCERYIGGRRDTGSDSDWGEYLRTTGPGSHTTLNLTHVGNSLGHMTY